MADAGLLILEFVAFLLPIAAASGWYAAKRHYEKENPPDRARHLTRDYCRGLNYLLSEKTEKAFALFTDLLERDPETLDTHLALGNLFRRRGEVERAIEVHERLLQESSLRPDQRDHAYFELGMDYLRAGLLDRAEVVFQALRKSPWRGRESLQQLLQIYQQEREWHKAIDCTRALQEAKHVPARGESLSQLLCELAEESLSRGRVDEAVDYLSRALTEDNRCVRASLILARVEMEQGAFAKALRTLLGVESQNPAFLPEVLGLVSQCLARLDRPEDFIVYAQRLDTQYDLPQIKLQIADHLASTQGPEAAFSHLKAAIRSRPTLQGASKILDLAARIDAAGNPDIVEISGLISRMSANRARYRCLQCGFSGVELHWHCPSCQFWGTIVPAEEI